MEDSNIYSDFDQIVHNIELFWRATYPVLASTGALRIYALVFIAIAVIGAAYIAYRAKKKLTHLQNVAIDLKFPGPHPANENSIEKRYEVLKARAEDVLSPFRRAMWILLLTGLIVPTALFAVGIVGYGWLDPTGLPFFDPADGNAIQSIDETSTGWFILNQFSHGAMFDVFEVFNVDLAKVSNNPANYWFSGAVLLYRTIASAFVVALVIALAQLVFVTATFRGKIAKEIKHFRQPASFPAAA